MLRDMQTEGETVKLTWTDGHRVSVPLLWLRDHCPCPVCLHPETRQRLSDSFVGADIVARRISFAANDRALEIEWAEKGGVHASRFEDAWLRTTMQLNGAAEEP